MYAEVEELEDYVYGVTERRAQALVRTAQERFSEYAQYAPRLSPDVELTVAEGGDPGYLADYIAQNIPVDVAAKQEILEELGITRRLAMVIRLLGEETEVLKIENEIQDELKTQIDKNQQRILPARADQGRSRPSWASRTIAARRRRSYRDARARPCSCRRSARTSSSEGGATVLAKLPARRARAGRRAHLSGHRARPAVEQEERGTIMTSAAAQAILDRDHYGTGKGQGAHYGVPCGARALRPTSRGRCCAWSARPACRQDLDCQVRLPRRWAAITRA